VFFLSNDDLKNSEKIKHNIKDDYFRLLKQQDEFDLFDGFNFHLEFDSKQNLDENYSGNLYYYFK